MDHLVNTDVSVGKTLHSCFCSTHLTLGDLMSEKGRGACCRGRNSKSRQSLSRKTKNSQKLWNFGWQLAPSSRNTQSTQRKGSHPIWHKVRAKFKNTLQSFFAIGISYSGYFYFGIRFFVRIIGRLEFNQCSK